MNNQKVKGSKIMKKIYVFLPCYNEELNIIDLIESWNKHVTKLQEKGFNLQIFGINDCSKDKTKDKIKEMERKCSNVHLIDHEVNKGLVGGLNTAIETFIKLGKKDDFMVLMDGDNTHDPKYIFDQLEEIQKGYDCVIASRYCKSSDVIGVAAHRVFMSDMAGVYYKLMLNVPNVKDYTCGYRIYTYDIIINLVKNFGKDPIKEKSFACMMEFLYKLHLCGAKFSEVGFQLRYDFKKGESKMKVFKTMKNSLRVGWYLRRKGKKLFINGEAKKNKN